MLLSLCMADLHDEHATIDWYRTPVQREILRALNARSDVKGLLQTVGFLAVFCCAGAAAIWSAFAEYWLLTPFLLFLHGTVGSFNTNGVHELCHNTVFKAKFLNGLFLRIYGFIGWNDWVWFNASHANHHRYTMHPPRDGEVVVPEFYAFLSRKGFWLSAIWQINPFTMVWSAIKKARGKWDDDWTLLLFPPDNPDACRRLKNWNRFVVVGHSLILLATIVMVVTTGRLAWLLVPYVVSLSTTYGGCLFYLVNHTQHVGLTDKVRDFRVCCRSMKLPWWASFLYWHMEYHTEHHMYAAVPCYNLRRLHREIAFDLPEPKGFIGTWAEIAVILERQAQDPDYHYCHPLPDTAHSLVMGDAETEHAACTAAVDEGADCADLNAENGDVDSVIRTA